MLHLISLNDWKTDLIEEVLEMAGQIKAASGNYANTLERKTLLMMFEKPSLRTRVSFETGMSQLGGHAIFYDMTTSPLGAGKETIHDTVMTVCRYVDIIMARLFDHAKILEMAELATVPVINALTDFEHPCQVLADLMTVHEKKGKLKGLTLAYLGDSNNNVTHSLLYGCAKMGMNIRVGCPPGDEFSPLPKVLKAAEKTAAENGCAVKVTHDAVEAAKGADVVYTDSWMSYHVPPHKLNERIRVFTPYQVNAELMKQAAKDAIFLNCLPALRGYEQTAEVIDGPQSVVFDQAENRLHVQKAVMLKLLSAKKAVEKAG